MGSTRGILPLLLLSLLLELEELAFSWGEAAVTSIEIPSVCNRLCEVSVQTEVCRSHPVAVLSSLVIEASDASLFNLLLLPLLSSGEESTLASVPFTASAVDVIEGAAFAAACPDSALC